MIALVRTSDDPYAVELGTFPLEEAANKGRKVPAEWILPAAKDLSQGGLRLPPPLIAGGAAALSKPACRSASTSTKPRWSSRPLPRQQRHPQNR